MTGSPVRQSTHDQGHVANVRQGRPPLDEDYADSADDPGAEVNKTYETTKESSPAISESHNFDKENTPPDAKSAQSSRDISPDSTKSGGITKHVTPATSIQSRRSSDTSEKFTEVAVTTSDVKFSMSHVVTPAGPSSTVPNAHLLPEPEDLERDCYGSKHKARSAWMMKQDAAAQLAAGLITREEHDYLALSVEEKNKVKMPASLLTKYEKDMSAEELKLREDQNKVIPSLEYTKKMEAKHDVEMEKWLEDGTPISRPALRAEDEPEYVPDSEEQKALEQLAEMSDSMSDSDKENVDPVATPNRKVKKTYTNKGKGKQTTVATGEGALDFLHASDTSSLSSARSDVTPTSPIIRSLKNKEWEHVPKSKRGKEQSEESDSDKLSELDSDDEDLRAIARKDPLYRPNKSTKSKTKANAKKSASHSPSKVTKTKKAKAKTPKTAGPKYIPQPGEIDYSAYNYYQCAALCRERGIIRGGGQDIVRIRLQKDDKLILENKQDEREWCTYEKGKKPKREYKHQAPALPAVTPVTARSASATPALAAPIPVGPTPATPTTPPTASKPIPPASPKRKRAVHDIDGKDDEDVAGSNSENEDGSDVNGRPKKVLKKA